MNAEIENLIKDTADLFSADLETLDFEQCKKLAYFCVIVGVSASEMPYFDDDIVNNCEKLTNMVSMNLNEDDRIKIKQFIEEKFPTIMEDNNISSEESFAIFLAKLLSEFDDNVRENCLVFIYEYLMKDDTHIYREIDDFNKLAQDEIVLRFTLASAGTSSDRVRSRIEEYYNIVRRQHVLDVENEDVDSGEDGYYEDDDFIPGVSEDEVKAARAILAGGFEALQDISDEQQALLTKVMLAFSSAGRLFGGPDGRDTD